MADARNGWVGEIVAALEDGGRVTVVCRTSATQREVFRRLHDAARAGGRSGWAGLHVATLHGVVASNVAQRLVPAAAAGAGPLPDRHAWRPLLEDRPGLAGELAEIVERAHGAAAAGVDLARLRPELKALVDAGWGRSERLDGTLALLRRPPPEGRVFAIGFPEGSNALGQVSPLDRRVLDWLGATRVEGGSPATARLEKLDAIRAPDVVAEARAVAKLAGGAGGRVVVLVADAASEERLQAALRRNGLAVADDAAAPLHRHSLAAVIEPILPLFVDRGEGAIEAGVLLRFLTDPVLTRRPPKRGITEVAGLEHPRASPRHVRELVAGCRRARGTFDEWLRDLRRLEAEAVERVTEARTRVELGEAPEEVVDGAKRRVASVRIAIAQVETLAARARGEGTLADVAAALEEIGLSSPLEDRLGHAMIRALRDERFQPADSRAFADALGRAVGSGRIDRGVQLLSYAAYDGRDSDVVLLTGVHHRGVSAAVPPSPFLRDEDATLLGLPTPRESVAERLAIARWAASRAGRAIAVVTATDASGRRVTPPVDLPLVYDDGAAAHAYGLELDLPECRDLGAFVETSSAARDDEAGMQVDAEWARSGAIFADAEGGTLTAAPEATLLEHLDGAKGRVPPPLRPLLGECGARADGSSPLPDGVRLSATRLESFTQCLYRAFVKNVLRIEAPEEVTEDLDAREMGTAVHAAFQVALEGAELLVPEAKVDAARARVLAKLEEATAKAMHDIAAKRPAGADAPSLALAREGLARRWVAHWPDYLDGRIEALEDARAEAVGERLAPLLASPELGAVIEALGPKFAKTPRDRLLKNVVAALCDCAGDLRALLASGDRITDGLAAKNVGIVRAALESHGHRGALERLCARACELLAGFDFDPSGDLEVVAMEHPIGEQEPLLIPLGRGTIGLRGRIDAIARRRGGKGDPARYRIIDFKTGRHPPKATELVDSLTKPQLAAYALALEQAGPVTPTHGDTCEVESIELDHVRIARQVEASLDEAAREHARRTFGGLLDRGRDGSFPLTPHPGGCPLLGRGAYCDYLEACRLRPDYAQLVEEEA